MFFIFLSKACFSAVRLERNQGQVNAAEILKKKNSKETVKSTSDTRQFFIITAKLPRVSWPVKNSRGIFAKPHFQY